MPRSTIIAMVKRNDKYLIPGGSTVIEENDDLVVLSDTEEAINSVMESLRSGTIPGKR